MQTRLSIVGVMGSGCEPHTKKAGVLGAWLAREGVHLLTGGGGGVMEAASRAFYNVAERRGLVIGILPGTITANGYESFAGYPNPWIELPVVTHLPLSGFRGTDPQSRNHINILSSTVIVALPGSHGTASEIRLAMNYGRPLIAWLDSRDQVPGLPEQTIVAADFKDIQTFVRQNLD